MIGNGAIDGGTGDPHGIAGTAGLEVAHGERVEDDRILRVRQPHRVFRQPHGLNGCRTDGSVEVARIQARFVIALTRSGLHPSASR